MSAQYVVSAAVHRAHIATVFLCMYKARVVSGIVYRAHIAAATCTEHVFQRSFCSRCILFCGYLVQNTCFSAAVYTESVPLATVNMACVFSAALVRMLPQSAAAHIL